MKKAIVITPNEEIKTIDYEDGIDFIQKQVGGGFKIFYKDFIDTFNGKIDFLMFCDDEYLLKDTCDNNKVNAIATGLYGFPVYGNVLVLKDYTTPEGEKDSTGFEYLLEDVGGGQLEEAICENWFIEDYFMRIRNKGKEDILNIHEHFDNRKPTPELRVTCFENDDKNPVTKN